MATQSSVIAWKIPWTEEPGELWSKGLQRVGHDWSNLLLGRKVMTNLDSIFKSRDITLPTKVRLVKAMVFSSGHVWMWELDYKESWVPKNWCFWTVVLEKTTVSPLDWKEIKPFYPKGNQSWIFTGKTDAETKTLILGGYLIWRTNSLEKTDRKSVV